MGVWSWRESNPRPQNTGRGCYDHSRVCGLRLPLRRVVRTSRVLPPGLCLVSAVFAGCQRVFPRRPPLLVLPGCSGPAPRAIAGRSVPSAGLIGSGGEGESVVVGVSLGAPFGESGRTLVATGGSSGSVSKPVSPELVGGGRRAPGPLRQDGVLVFCAGGLLRRGVEIGRDGADWLAWAGRVFRMSTGRQDALAGSLVAARTGIVSQSSPLKRLPARFLLAAPHRRVCRDRGCRSRWWRGWDSNPRKAPKVLQIMSLASTPLLRPAANARDRADCRCEFSAPSSRPRLQSRWWRLPAQPWARDGFLLAGCRVRGRVCDSCKALVPRSCLSGRRDSNPRLQDGILVLCLLSYCRFVAAEHRVADPAGETFARLPCAPRAPSGYVLLVTPRGAARVGGFSAWADGPRLTRRVRRCRGRRG